jgi:3-hydroxyisobutyrate dehydrogenase
MDVGFIGLGDQGAPMAEAILEAGHTLHVWARRPGVVAPFVERGAIAHDDPRSLAAAADQLALCVVSEADVRQILFEHGALAAMRRGALVVVHSTIGPRACKDLAEKAAAQGLGFLDAPVSGGRIVAQQRKLLVMVGGDPFAFADAEPVFRTYGSNVHLLGTVGSGQVAKIVNNVMLSANLAVAEYMLEFGEALGIERAKLRALLLTGTAQSWALDALDRLVVRGQAKLALAEKDLSLAADVVQENPLTAALATPFIELSLRGWRRLALPPRTPMET